jgi:hypothetical protein
MRLPLAGRLIGIIKKSGGLVRLVRIIIPGFATKEERQLAELIAEYDVVIMKHCFPASDVLEDMGKADPSSPRQSPENYRAIYRLLRSVFDQNPDKLFVVWTLPPRHRLFKPADGDRDANATRATAFSKWLAGDFLGEEGEHPNIYVWDFRELVMDHQTSFLRYEYELNHNAADSHPNRLANNQAGPRFAQFIVDSIADFAGIRPWRPGAKIAFLCHSTGQGVYGYGDKGVQAWFDEYNAARGTKHSISKHWYPPDGNMPVDYVRLNVEGGCQISAQDAA